MIELATAITKRNISFENPYIIWLLALLSSQISCNKYLYNTIPKIVDYVYQNVTNNFTAVTEVYDFTAINILFYYFCIELLH